eukprot:scaffold180528_cov53-Attheya_sp.AAC.1
MSNGGCDQKLKSKRVETTKNAYCIENGRRTVAGKRSINNETILLTKEVHQQGERAGVPSRHYLV